MLCQVSPIQCPRPFASAFFRRNSVHVVGRVFAGGEDGVEDRQEHSERANVEQQVGVGGGQGMEEPEQAGVRAQGPGQPGVNIDAAQVERGHRAGADGEGDVGVGGGVLGGRGDVGDDGPVGAHAGVDAGVQDPQEQGGQDQRGTDGGHDPGNVGHEQERDAGQDRPDQEERAPAAQAGPGAVAERADDGLDQDAGDRARPSRKWRTGCRRRPASGTARSSGPSGSTRRTAGRGSPRPC